MALLFFLFIKLNIFYRIEVQLDTADKFLNGKEIVRIENKTSDTIRELYFHLYPNAFRDANTTFFKEIFSSYLFSFLKFFIKKEYTGWIKIDSIFEKKSHFKIDFHLSETLMEISLNKFLLPDSTLELEIYFREKIPKHRGARAGYRENQYDIAQWYPALCVYKNSKWFKDQYHFYGEFFNPFADYEVEIEVPSKFVVIAPGEIIKGDPGFKKEREEIKEPETEGFKKVTFRAQNVVDFVFSASPDFIMQDTTYKGIKIRSFYSKKRKEFKDSMLIYAFRAISYCDSFLGPYPYPVMNIVSSLFSGGMEYPQFVHCGRKDESLVVHEIGHNWFYALWATDQVNSAWLDEGGTTFQTRKYMNIRYGNKIKEKVKDPFKRFMPERTRDEELNEEILYLVRNGWDEPLAQPSYRFKNNYWLNYTKGSKIYQMIEYILGKEKFKEFLNEYYNNYIFKHPTEEEFFKTVEKVYGKSIDWFYIPWIYNTMICDYGIKKGKTERVNEFYLTEVFIYKKGEIAMPLKVIFEGKSQRDSLFIHEPVFKDTTILIKSYFPVEKISLNPNNEILDFYLFDNFSPRKLKFAFFIPSYPAKSEYYLFKFDFVPGYNSIDGAKSGISLKGTYLWQFSNINMFYLYGIKSKTKDYGISYHTYFPFRGMENQIGFNGMKMEGREKFSLYYFRRLHSTMNPPISGWLYTGLIYRFAKDLSYVNTMEWEKGKEKIVFASLLTRAKFDLFTGELNITLNTVPSFISHLYKYQKLTSVFKISPEQWFRIFPFDFLVRFYAGYIWGNAPKQSYISLSSAGPWEKYNSIWTRSKGSLPNGLYFLEGDGNLKGYLNSISLFPDLISFNFETEIPPFFLLIPFKIFPGKEKIFVFYDYARRIRENSSFNDAGIKISHSFFIGAREIKTNLFFPFYVDKPELNKEKEKFDFRFSFNFQLHGF